MKLVEPPFGEVLGVGDVFTAGECKRDADLTKGSQRIVE